MFKFKIIIIPFLLLQPFFLFSQQIDNSDFENWESVNEAVGWTTSITNGGLTVYTAQRTDEAYSGNYAAKLITKNIFGYIIPGMIQLGVFDVDQMELTGGLPFTAKPTALQVYLKYDQQANDSLAVVCYLSRYDQSQHKSIYIGGAYFLYDKPIHDYQVFLIPIYYLEDSTTPDTINIGFLSANMDPHAGSTLWVDNFKLLYGEFLLPPQAIFPEEISIDGFNASWTGAPFTKKYYLDVATDVNFTNYLPGYHSLDVGDTTKYYIKLDSNISSNSIFYRLKADYDSVISDYSNIVEIPVPYPPIAQNAENISSSSFLAKWSEIPKASKYIFDVGLDSNFENFLPGYYFYTTTQNEVNVVGLERDSTYYYRVRSYFLGGYKSVYSNTIKVKTEYNDSDLPVQFFIKRDEIAIYCSKELLGSEFFVYDINGNFLKKGILNNRFTYVPYKGINILLFKIMTPSGILTKKVMVYDIGN